MTSGKIVGYFGYGSLVNRKTLRTAFLDATRAELKGFRREWRIRGETPLGPVCSLTAARDATVSIEGLLVIDRAENLPQVDEREFRYDRVAIRVEDLDLERDVDVDEIYVYQAKTVHIGVNDASYPIWQSYADAVMQGYFHEFGRAGLDRFVAHTAGWNKSMLADRHQPRYERAVELSDWERRHFDALLHGESED